MSKSKVYTLDGDIIDLDYMFNGLPVFRKMTNSQNEKHIANMLLGHNIKHVVTIYSVTETYIDMELLDTNMPTLPEDSLKDSLQSLGIMYIDWKHDNIGTSSDNVSKLFDFDMSGLVDVNNPDKWIICPPKYYAYKNAIDSGAVTPKEIDDMAFYNGLKPYTK
jgi:serine/threonine protein kinase